MTDAVLWTGLVVPVPQAAAAVDGWRERTCGDRPSAGVPAHITVLFPFRPAQQVNGRVVAALGALFGGEAEFSFDLRELRRFPATLYLAPEPAQPFIRLTELVMAQFPDCPPFGGTFDSIVPHLTVAHGDADVLDEAGAEVAPFLPIRSAAREALLLEEVAPNWGRWEVLARLPLGAKAGP